MRLSSGLSARKQLFLFKENQILNTILEQKIALIGNRTFFQNLVQSVNTSFMIKGHG